MIMIGDYSEYEWDINVTDKRGISHENMGVLVKL
jgi:hypothetical protein